MRLQFLIASAAAGFLLRALSFNMLYSSRCTASGKIQDQCLQVVRIYPVFLQNLCTNYRHKSDRREECSASIRANGGLGVIRKNHTKYRDYAACLRIALKST